MFNVWRGFIYKKIQTGSDLDFQNATFYSHRFCRVQRYGIRVAAMTASVILLTWPFSADILVTVAEKHH
jgi:hypothetical protein